ncbi:MAG: ABC transporter permease [Longimicrobiales bacterium]
MDSFRQDMLFALRSFVRAPLFSMTLLLTLGVTLAAAITTFGVVDSVLVRPLPLNAPDRVFVGWTNDEARGFEHFPFPPAVVDALPDNLSTIEAAGAIAYFGTFEWLMEAGGGAEVMRLAAITGDFFGALGASAAAGELPDEFVQSRDEQAPLVLSHAYWQRRFGGAPVIGRTVRIQDQSYEVRGVGPEDLHFPEGVDAWAPFPSAILEGPAGDSPLFDVVVRLKQGVTIAAARVEMERTVRQLYTELAGMDASRHTLTLQPLKQILTGDARPWLRAVGLLVAVLLFVALLNATVLLLIRGLDRAREIAVRYAAGATRGRLLRQVATENLLLMAAACLVAVVAAAWALDLLRASAPPGLPRAGGIRLDLRSAGFAALAGLVMTTVLSTAVAFTACRRDPSRLLRSGARSVGNAGARLRDVLVAGQIAMTVVVLGAAGVVARSLYNLSALETGFATESLVLAEIALPAALYPDGAANRRAFREIIPAVEAMPGVQSASGLLSDPFPGTMWNLALTAEGQDAIAAGANPVINYEAVDEAYFTTLAPRILRGRGIDERDRSGAPLTVVINLTLASLFWPGIEPLGKRLKFGGAHSPDEWRTVVGVVEDIRYMSFEEIQPTIYFSYDQGMSVLAPRYLAIRMAGVRPGIEALKAVVQQVAAGAVVLEAPAMGELLQRPLARPRFHTLLLSCFAATALALTAIGVYGSLGTTVRQRRSELAIRLALGARPTQLRALVLRRAGWMAAAGLAVGTAAAVLVLRIIASLLYGVEPADPATLGTVAVLILVTATVAAWIPAHSATATDPNSVLRAE